MKKGSWNAFAEEVDDVGLLSKPGCCLHNLDMGEHQHPEIQEAVANGEESGADPAEESVTRQPPISEVGRQHSRSMPRELDFEEPGRQEGLFRTQLRLSRHPMYVFVLGSDPEAPEEVQGLVGLTPDALGHWMLIWSSFLLGWRGKRRSCSTPIWQ